MKFKRIMAMLAVLILTFSVSASASTQCRQPRRSHCRKRYRCIQICPTPTASPAGAPCTKPAATPVATAASNPVITPEATPTAAPVATPVVTPKPTAKPTPAATPVATEKPSDSSAEFLPSMASEVIEQVNVERTNYGLGSLSYDSVLTEAAKIRAKEISEVFSHTRPDGSSWSTVSSAAYGENIAMGYSSVDKVMAAWLTSEGHRANIMKESYTSIGVAACRINGVIYWVQLFGKG